MQVTCTHEPQGEVLPGGLPPPPPAPLPLSQLQAARPEATPPGKPGLFAEQDVSVAQGFMGGNREAI